MTNDPHTEIVRIRVNRKGRKFIELPYWAWLALYKKSKIRSRRKRHILKAVKNQFHIALMQSLDAHAKEVAVTMVKL